MCNTPSPSPLELLAWPSAEWLINQKQSNHPKSRNYNLNWAINIIISAKCPKIKIFLQWQLGDLSISPPREIIFKQIIERNSAKIWQFKRCLTGPNVFSNNSINDLILSHSRYLLDMARQNVFHSCLLTQTVSQSVWYSY